MDHDQFILFLHDRLNHPLPGWDAQQIMSPRIEGKTTNEPRTVSPNAKNTAVAALLMPGKKGSELIFTLRSSSVTHHKGQICLPGGRSEQNESIVETAIRETFEEIGLHEETISIIGNLSSLYVPPSNSLMNIIVANVRKPMPFSINYNEVAEVFTVPLYDLAFHHEIEYVKTLRSAGFEVEAPSWRVHETSFLWGATAMCVSELLHLYKEFKGVL